MIEDVQNIDLVSLAQQAGVSMHSSGNKHVGSCPFHEDRTPSFYIFQDNKFKCFGCGEYGDQIDFVRRLYGYSFQDALKHLGIQQGPVDRQTFKKIQQRKKDQALIKKFRDWESRYADEMALYARTGSKALSKMKTISEMEKHGDLYHAISKWEYHLEILINGSDRDKLELFKEVGDTFHNLNANG